MHAKAYTQSATVLLCVKNRLTSDLGVPEVICHIVRYHWVKVRYQVENIVNQKDCVIISKQHPLEVI